MDKMEENLTKLIQSMAKMTANEEVKVASEDNTNLEKIKVVPATIVDVKDVIKP